MNKLIFAALMLLCTWACNSQYRVITITNDSALDRIDEIVELEIDNPDDYVVYNDNREEITSQVTYDGKLIFAATIDANSEIAYTIKKGKKAEYETIAYASFHPEFYDDIAWENDKIGFRVSAKPQLQFNKFLYGYDVFTKRVSYPVLDELYDNTFGEEMQAARKALTKSDPDSLARYVASVTYHNDHGKGMDYYLVGPTLGCGTAALVVDGTTQYPLYYDTYKILDNGPLRATITMDFDAENIAGESVVERRVLTMNAHSHFFKVDITYQGLSQATPIIAGVVMRDAAKDYAIGSGYAAYAEPAQKCGQTYTAVIFDEELQPRVDLFDKARMKSHGGAFGHIQAEGVYSPKEHFVYYSGAGWNKWQIPSSTAWFAHVEQQQQKYATPLKCRVK